MIQHLVSYFKFYKHFPFNINKLSTLWEAEHISWGIFSLFQVQLSSKVIPEQ